MSIPKLDLPKYEPPKHMLLIDNVRQKLYAMGYPCVDKRDIVKYIEENNLDISQFEFPEGDYEKFKENLDAGAYDVEIRVVSDEELARDQEKLRNGELYVMY